MEGIDVYGERERERVKRFAYIYTAIVFVGLLLPVLHKRLYSCTYINAIAINFGCLIVS